jgi:hypothetical protein
LSNLKLPFELNDLTSVYTNPSFQHLMKEHRDSLQKEVNILLRAEKFTQAYGELCKMDDVDKILDLVWQRMEKLKSNKEG